MFKEYLKPRYLVMPLILAIITVVFFKMAFSPEHKDLMVVNNQVASKKLSNDKPVKKVIYSDEQVDVQVLNNVRFFLDGKLMSFDSNIFEKAQRYYLPLDNVINSFGGSYSEDSNQIDILCNNNKYAIGKKDLSVKVGSDAEFKLRGDILTEENKTYLSLSDIENMFNLIDEWDYDKKQISMFRSKKEIKVAPSKTSGTAALIRFEDVSAGDVMTTSDNLERMKVIADYLYSEGVKFNMGWIPRFRDPENNIDNDLLKVHNMQNAQFINMLDHMIFRGATVGIHGYTHQYGNEKSITGWEIDKDKNNDVASTTKIIESALETADALDIPVSFFETPHYGATQLQQYVIEDYFKYIYEPFEGLFNCNPAVSLRNDRTIYVPASLGYVSEKSIEPMLNKIKNRPAGTLASLFYHPSKEFDSIKFYKEKDGYINYTYSEDSSLHKIIQILKDNGYVTISITQIK